MTTTATVTVPIMPTTVMALNGLESLYGLDMRRSEEMTAADIMETDLNVVPCKTTVRFVELRQQCLHAKVPPARALRFDIEREKNSK